MVASACVRPCPAFVLVVDDHKIFRSGVKRLLSDESDMRVTDEAGNGALKHLGIEHIAAYSPQARGRSERMFGTLQGRLPKDLRLAGITTVEAANAWLKAHYIAEHNAAFAIKPQQQGTAFVVDRHEAWREALCVIEERTVANDNTIAWRGRRLQLPQSRLRPHFVKAVVRVHHYPAAPGLSRGRCLFHCRPISKLGEPL